MAKFLITGGKKLKGSIVTSTSKNATMGILCASVMVRAAVTLKDVPRIQEVDRMLELLESIGVPYEWKNETTLLLDSSGPLRMDAIDKIACQKTRSSLMLLGALSKQVKQYKLYKTGGCKLGERTVRPHMYALEKLGVSVVSKEHYYDVKNTPTKGQEIVMYESGDTPTENAIMAAALTPGTTTITFASSNYMVQDLCYFLVKAGAKIKGIGTTTLTITGVKKLKSVRYAIMPDPIIAMTWVSLGITTKSPLIIANCPLQFLQLELEKLAVMGQAYTLKNKRKSANGKFDVVDVVLKPSELMAVHSQG